MIYLFQPVNLMLFFLNIITLVMLFTLIKHFQGVAFIKSNRALKQRYIKGMVVTTLMLCILIVAPNLFPFDLKFLAKGLRWLLFVVATMVVVWIFLRRRNRQLIESRNFYKIFKYIFTQLDSGALLHQTYKTVYHVVDEPSIKNRLLKFSVMLSQEHQIEEAMAYLNKSFRSDEGRIFNSVMQNIEHNSMTSNGLINVDQMLFQKYLSSIRAETKKIERQYIFLIVIFTFQVMLFLMLPLLSQMVESAQNIFR
jgi:hypothetical protein